VRGQSQMRRPLESNRPISLGGMPKWAIRVRTIVLWRKEIENQPGTLASTLEPFASQGGDLQLVIGGKGWLPLRGRRASRLLGFPPFWWKVITSRGAAY